MWDWTETSTKCSKYIMCINYASQAEARQITVDTASNSRQSGSASRTGAGHHVRHPVYISGLPRGRQRTTGTKSHTPKREIPCTQTVARHNERPQTIMALISRVPAPMLGTTKNFRPNARDPPRTRLNTTTSQFSLPSTGDPCIIHKNKNGPVESECKLNNVNPHIIRNQIQNQIEVTLNKHSTANHVITIQKQNSNIPFKYQVNLPWNTLVGLPKAFQRKTNWKYWIKYIKPIWCPQQNVSISRRIN